MRRRPRRGDPRLRRAGVRVGVAELLADEAVIPAVSVPIIVGWHVHRNVVPAGERGTSYDASRDAVEDVALEERGPLASSTSTLWGMPASLLSNSIWNGWSAGAARSSVVEGDVRLLWLEWRPATSRRRSRAAGAGARSPALGRRAGEAPRRASEPGSAPRSARRGCRRREPGRRSSRAWLRRALSATTATTADRVRSVRMGSETSRIAWMTAVGVFVTLPRRGALGHRTSTSDPVPHQYHRPDCPGTIAGLAVGSSPSGCEAAPQRRPEPTEP